MGKFSYIAIEDGIKQHGVIEARDINDARSKLRSDRLMVVDIKQKKEISMSKYHRKKKIKSDSLSHFCRQFSIIVSSGINTIVGLETLAVRTENKVLASEIKRVVEDVKMGSTIAGSMLNEKSKFPRLLGAMVSTGEETGTLEDVLKSMSVFYEREHKINQKIKNASMYPAIVSVLSVIMLFVYTSFIIPQMVESIVEVGGELPLMTKIIIAVGEFMNKWWYLVLLAVFILIYIIKEYVKTPIGRYNRDIFVKKMPLLGKGISSIVSMRFSRTLYLFISTGYPLLQGLDHIRATLNNSIAEKATVDAKEGVMRGENIAENLEKSNYFDSVFIQMIAIGEQTGQLEVISEQMAEFYEHESDIYLTRLISMIEPILIIIVGIVVAILVMSVFLPMLSIYEAL